MREIDKIAESIKSNPNLWTYYRIDDNEYIEWIKYIRAYALLRSETIQIEKIELHNSFAPNNFHVKFKSSDIRIPSKLIIIPEPHFPKVIADFFELEKSKWVEFKEDKQEKLVERTLKYL